MGEICRLQGGRSETCRPMEKGRESAALVGQEEGERGSLLGGGLLVRVSHIGFEQGRFRRLEVMCKEWPLVVVIPLMEGMLKEEGGVEVEVEVEVQVQAVLVRTMVKLRHTRLSNSGGSGPTDRESYFDRAYEAVKESH